MQHPHCAPSRSALLGAMVLSLTACGGGNGGHGSGQNALDDADLAALELSAGDLGSSFDPGTTDYTLDTLSGIASTTITATTSDRGATLEINGRRAVSGRPFGPVGLGFGETAIAVVVTAEDGVTTKTYTTTVRRFPFNMKAISVLDGSVWTINHEMVFRFTEELDFSSVSANTLEIRSDDGVPATGGFELRDERTLVFQPTCPVREDLSDVGLQPGGVHYTIRVPGTDLGATNTLRSRSGGLLQVTQVRHFATEDATNPFFDPTVGPPHPVVRAQGSLEEDATHLEIGGDPGQRVYFERDANQALVLSVPDFESPLHLFSDERTHVALVIEFDQPILPTRANLSLLRLEFLDAGTWRPLGTRVTLLGNCVGSGARASLEPTSILPRATEVRAVVLEGFTDLVGDFSIFVLDDFASFPTTPIEFTSLTPADRESDEIREGFDLGGAGTLEDTDSVLDLPRAEWGAGRLSAAFAFDGTGGPNGDFDWMVHSGETFFFDTTTTLIIGGPGGVPTRTVEATGGVVELRNFTIEEGGTVRVQGPNPMRIFATGEVRIAGKLDLSGFDARNVEVRGDGGEVEFGGDGAAGGGRGGSANDNVVGPTPHGGNGQGAFRSVDGGGEGGEMGVSSNASKNARRPGGGGGGRFAGDWIGTTTSSGLSLVAESGGDGNPASRGAESGISPARGGAKGRGPFLDADAGNDFFGVRPLVTNGRITALIRGELAGLSAGGGGGGGGNAGKVFPNPSWNFSSDEKGGAGGGGAGALQIKALGRIVFGRAGEIVANGGRGGTGENTNFLDHIGGSGGEGSGGHVVLESATAIDFTDGGANEGADPREFVLAAGPQRNTGPTEDVDTCAESSLCCPSGCKSNSNGGAGGAGVIQLHVPDPARAPDSIPSAQIRVPSAALQAADVLDQLTSPPAYVMMPTFARRSIARSKWISLGQADREPDGSRDRVSFLFSGIRTSGVDEGKIATNGVVVPESAPLLQGALEGSPIATILPDGLTLSLRGAALAPFLTGSTFGISNDLYLRTPALLREFVLRIDAGSTVGDFDVADASYDEGSAAPGDEELRITAAAGPAGTLRSFFDLHVADPGALPYVMIPRSFRVVTDGTQSFLPESTFVRILFQGAGEDSLGNVDAENPLVDWTGDIARFDALEPGQLRFFRFQVEFDLGAISDATRPVLLDFLKVPFVF